jgi:hypothetical protein
MLSRNVFFSNRNFIKPSPGLRPVGGGGAGGVGVTEVNVEGTQNNYKKFPLKHWTMSDFSDTDYRNCQIFHRR